MEPTVVIKIGPSFITCDSRGELLETVDVNPDGTPDWSTAATCDARGGGGSQGYKHLFDAIAHAETNALLCGFEIDRVQ